MSTSHLINESSDMHGGKKIDTPLEETRTRRRQGQPEGVSASVTPKNPISLRERVLSTDLSNERARSQSRGKNTQNAQENNPSSKQERSGE